MIRRILLVIFLGLLFVTPAGVAIAQTTNNDITTTVFPENPGPFESVTITLSSLIRNLNAADIRWTMDDKVVLAGLGKHEFSFSTKDIGVSSTVVVIITPLGSAPITRRITITPASVDLLWQTTNSSVPPLYRGKAMPATEAELKIVAIPTIKAGGKILQPNELIYSWKRDYSASGAGYGKSSFTVTSSDIDPIEQINVTAQTRDGKITTTKGLTIAPTKPKIVWYELSPLYGPNYTKALTGEYTLSGADLQILAEPYFFSPRDIGSSKLKYTWLVNGTKTTTPVNPNVLYLKRDEKQSGTATLALTIENISRVFQEASSSLKLYLD